MAKSRDESTRDAERRPDASRPRPPAQTEFALFFTEYGSFLALWGTFELVIEILIMRTLRLQPQEASIVCGGLGFGGKTNVLYSLLSRDPSNKTGSDLLKAAQRAAERNHFAHGFVIKETTPYRFKVIRRDVKDKYSAKAKHLTFDDMSEHGEKFGKAFSAAMAHFNVTDVDIDDYAKSIESDASRLTSGGTTRL